MNHAQAALRNEVRQLAEEAFYRKLISGHGDGPDLNEYQIVYQGKPRHIPLEPARFFLINLLYRSRIHLKPPVDPGDSRTELSGGRNSGFIARHFNRSAL
jgi:hypothetical protein